MIAEMLSEPHPLNGAARDPDEDFDSVDAPVDETDDVTGASEHYDLDDDDEE